MAGFKDYQIDIHLKGLSGEKPKIPVDFPNLQARAQAEMPSDIYDFVACGAGDEHTQDLNAAAFKKWALMPRRLVDCATRDLSVEMLNMRFASPLFLAPIGVIGPCRPDGTGDLETARGATAAGVPMVAATFSNAPMEEVAKALGDDGTGFFQLYAPNDDALAESLVRRAETAGFKAIVVTLDTWTLGWRPRDLNAVNFPQLRGAALANYFSDPSFRKRLARTPEEDRAAATLEWIKVFSRPLTWADIPWLRSLTKLPLILKGICHPDDARRAIDAGADAIYCSNHGGRQSNSGLATIDVLPQIVAACGTTPVLFDSGVRSGADIVKALAMGATMVGIGRPYAYGLGLGGAAGVEHVLRCLLAETDIVMAIDGYPTLADLKPEALVRT